MTFIQGDKGDPGEQVLKDKALDVAAAAHAALTAQYPYEHYEIQFVRQTTSDATTSQSWSYSFNASELPPAKSKI